MTKKGYIGVDGKARRVKKIYIGVDNKARKVKKAYIGVNGVARLWFSGDPIFKNVSGFPLVDTDYKGATVGDYAVYGYFSSYSSSTQTTVEVEQGITAYHKNLTYTTPTLPYSGTPSTPSTAMLTECGVFGKTPNHVVFIYSHGKAYKIATSYLEFASAYNSNLVKTSFGTPESFDYSDDGLAYTSNHAMFGMFCHTTNWSGGTFKNEEFAGPMAVSKELTISYPTAYSTPRQAAISGHVGQYALFVGGYTRYASGSSAVSKYETITDAYNANLVRSVAPTPDTTQGDSVEINNYALFFSPSGSDTHTAYNANLVKTTVAAFGGEKVSYFGMAGQGSNACAYFITSGDEVFYLDSNLVKHDLDYEESGCVDVDGGYYNGYPISKCGMALGDIGILPRRSGSYGLTTVKIEKQ